MNRAENAARVSRETAAQRAQSNTRHGMAKRGAIAPEWHVWASMHQRCSNPRAPGYENYGGRGIAVCARWARFDNFIADMGKRPSAGHSIDRINNDGPYSPDNCRWSTRSEQKANQRPRKDAIWIEHMGVSKTLDQWARDTGIKYRTLHARLSHGWSVERALSTPTRSYP